MTVLGKAIAMTVKLKLTWDEFLPNAEQMCAISSLTTAIISSFSGDLATSIITAEMPISPFHLVTCKLEKLQQRLAIDYQNLEIQADNKSLMQ